MSDADTRDQALLVADIEAAIYTYESQLRALQKTLRSEEKKLRDMCTHKVYRTEDNGDYHRPGVYYVCKTCKLIMTKKPE